MKTTWYFENIVLRSKRPYLRREWCEWVVRNPAETRVQPNGRIAHWAYVEEMRRVTGIDKYLLVVMEPDGETLHNAMPDRDFTRKRRREG